MTRRPSQVKRHRGKLRMDTALNLVSLMDIFTILLLFLLVQSSAEEVLPATESLKLPLSTAQAHAKAAVTVFVTGEQIVVEGMKAADVAEVLRSADPGIPGLEKELVYQAKKTLEIAKANPSVVFQGKVTIMGDREIPFALLKKVMVACSRAGYPNIALAVLQKEKA